MGRGRLNESEWSLDWRSLIAPTMLCVTVTFFSTLAFIYCYRNDLLILAAQHRSRTAIRFLDAVGASASGATEIFHEPALIEYLLALQSPTTPVTEGNSIAAILLASGASIDERTQSGWTPLMLAASSGQKSIVELLIQRGADVDARAFGNEQNEGLTALMAAAMRGHNPIVQLLVDKGANVHFRSRAGFTALLLAASRGHLNCVEILLEKGASVPLSTVQVAEKNGYTEVADRLRLAMARPRSEGSSRRPAQYPEQ